MALRSLSRYIEVRQAGVSRASTSATTIPARSTSFARAPVGASPLAMDVNDDAGCLNARVAPAFFVGTPPGAGSLLQWIGYTCR